MDVNNKQWQAVKIKKHLKKNNIFFLIKGKKIEFQIKHALKIWNFNAHQIYNKICVKLLNGCLLNIKQTIHGVNFLFFYSNAKLFKKILINYGYLLIIKINNKMYVNANVKTSFSLNYLTNKLLLFQFALITLKISK